MSTSELKIGRFMEFSGPNAQTLYGRIKRVVTGNGYTTVHLSMDGVAVKMGTGGHLGDTWTTGDGSQQWFLGYIK